MSTPMTDPTGTNPRGQEYRHRPGASTPTGATRAQEPKGRKPWWLLALLGLILLGLLIWGLTQCGNGASSTGTDRPAAPPAPAAPAPDADPGAGRNPAPAAPNAPNAGVPAAGTLTAAGGASLFPLAGAADPNGALTSLVGQEVTGRALQVLSVPADEGFWAGNDDTDRVWVELLPAQQESPVAVHQGDRIDLTGRMAAHGPEFAAQNGIDAAEGADQLTRQAAHIDAPQDQVRVVPAR